MTAVFLFPGQGSQAVGMGAAMIRAYPSVARRLAQGSALLEIDLPALIDRGPPRLLAQTHIAQVAMYCLSVAFCELLRDAGFHPALVAGHSLGQFSALTAAGAIDFDQGLQLVQRRGAAMHASNQAVDGAMLAVQGIDGAELLTDLIADADACWIANRNAPGQQVLAGLRSSLQTVQARLRERGISSVWLEVAGAYHTPLMHSAADAFSKAIDATVFRDALIPVVANSSARLMTTREQIIEEVHAHMLSPVNWVGTMSLIAQHAPPLLVELGLGRVLKGLSLRNRPDIQCMTTGTPAEFEATCRALQELTCVS